MSIFQAGDALKEVVFDRAYASDLIRAQRTCEEILKKNNLPVNEIITESRIRERVMKN